ncbi:MAG: hypothetical protein LBH43_03685 [Treponema sp.]|nr:hypothetical protein [Treponema sp.]
MPRVKADCQNIALDLVDACSSTIDRNTALKGVRCLCRYLGGGSCYIPAKKKEGRTFKVIYDVLCEAVGDH